MPQSDKDKQRAEVETESESLGLPSLKDSVQSILHYEVANPKARVYQQA